MRVGGRSAAVMNPLDKKKKEGRMELKKREERPMGGKQQEETRIEKSGKEEEQRRVNYCLIENQFYGKMKQNKD